MNICRNALDFYHPLYLGLRLFHLPPSSIGWPCSCWRHPLRPPVHSRLPRRSPTHTSLRSRNGRGPAARSVWRGGQAGGKQRGRRVRRARWSERCSRGCALRGGRHQRWRLLLLFIGGNGCVPRCVSIDSRDTDGRGVSARVSICVTLSIPATFLLNSVSLMPSTASAASPGSSIIPAPRFWVLCESNCLGPSQVWL